MDLRILSLVLERVFLIEYLGTFDNKMCEKYGN